MLPNIYKKTCPNIHRVMQRSNFSQMLEESHNNNNTNHPDRYSANTMSAWQVDTYGSTGNLRLNDQRDIPMLESSTDVLVKVSASSVNPLDVEMIGGFGSVLLNNLRKISAPYCRDQRDLPLIPGRDFAGRIVAKGMEVDQFEIGDEVYGVVKPHDQGCHAHYTITADSLIAKKPEFLSMEEASCLLYTGLTAWSALKISGGLILTSPKDKHVLVIGGAGGVGINAIQLLKAWKSQVVTICSTDAVPLVSSLSPNLIIDRQQCNFMEEVKSAGKYDIILDAAGLGETALEKYAPFLNGCGGSLVTLRSPLLANIDNYGLLGGSLKSLVDLAVPNVTTGLLCKGSLVKWGFFAPLAVATREISKLVAEGKIFPVVEKIYDFSELPAAYERMKQGHLRGKLVVRVKSEGRDED